jgi:ABC-type multidrug transport system ATPase subunit
MLMMLPATGCFFLQGTMTLLLGSPGSGKSTLLKLLSGRLTSKHLQVRAAQKQHSHSWPHGRV